ncbi:hypothetical protein [uncultured Brevundimonas sp.]|uniref:hypothetical protein n=1 Tax=uncultured Brevundimonas sp. TaxID=213418 RepID=UPI0026385908|nr:hypothetical protein [uncultured Brevundimonas sp.]
MLKRTAIIAVSVAVCGCQQHPSAEKSAESMPTTAAIPANLNPSKYAEWFLSCQDGQRLTVMFDHPRNMATVRRSDGLAFDLVRRPTSGAYTYTSGGNELKSEGQTVAWRTERLNDTHCEIYETKPVA